MTDSAVRIVHNPTGIVVQCQNERSQHKNRDSAMKQLRAKLYEHEMEKKREETRKTEASKLDINFGSQIRSYVLAPYRLIKDHRTKLSVGDVDRVLDGDLDPAHPRLPGVPQNQRNGKRRKGQSAGVIPPDLLVRAGAIIRNGGLVAFPTETVYGLGADALNAAAIERIYQVKGRPATSPLIVHVGSMRMAQNLVTEWPDAAEELADFLAGSTDARSAKAVERTGYRHSRIADGRNSSAGPSDCRRTAP